MFNPRYAALALSIALSVPAHAVTEVKFTPAAFAKAQAEGKPVLIDVAAWWCPVCLSQNRTIKRITANPAYNKLTIFKINYDSQKPEWQSLGVAKQGTLIGFIGKREVARVAFETDEAKIGGLLSAIVN